jgi:hypothetical protein
MTRTHFLHDRSSQPSLNVRRTTQTFDLHSKRIHSIRRFREFHRICCTVRHASSFLFNHFTLASCVHFLTRSRSEVARRHRKRGAVERLSGWRIATQ